MEFNPKELKKRSEEIDRMLLKEKKKLAKQSIILMLGAGQVLPLPTNSKDLWLADLFLPPPNPKIANGIPTCSPANQHFASRWGF